MDSLLKPLNPDKHLDLKMLFAKLNTMFFLGLLSDVDVVWSSRLRTLGGYCAFDPFSRYCRISINESYYQTRPRSDLIGALVHEMIHALMYLSKEDDAGGHGPLFVWYAEEFNKLLGGIKVPVYWDADDDEILQHWWQCNGPCQHVLKRAINRRPSRREKWFVQHQRICGGTYMKVREPENNARNGKRKRTTHMSTNPALRVGEGSHENRYPKRTRVT